MHDLEKSKRQLEQALLDQKAQVEELEDALQIAEDARLRLEVMGQATRTDIERQLAAKDAEQEEKRRALLKQVRDLEEELENERRGKSGAVTGKKKLESQVSELEQQLEVANRLKDEYNRQLRKNQVRGFIIWGIRERALVQGGDTVSHRASCMCWIAGDGEGLSA